MVIKAIKTLWTESEYLNRTTKIKYVVPAYLILGLGLVFAVVRLGDLNDTQLATVETQAALVDYTACIERADINNTVRNVLISIVALYPDTPQGELILEIIEKDLAVRDPADCGTLLT